MSHRFSNANTSDVQYSALGLTIGFFNREVLNPNEDRDRREAWTYTFDEAALPPETIQVQLSSAKLVEGSWERKTWSEQKRELYLQEPREVEFTDQGKETDPIGRGMYIHSDDISRVILTDSDPQTDPEEAETEEGKPVEKEIDDVASGMNEKDIAEAVDDLLESTDELNIYPDSDAEHSE